MPQELTGSLFPVDTGDIGVIINESDSGRSRYVDITTESTLRMFERFAIRERSIAANMLGIYASIPVGRNRKARFASISTPTHLFSSRKSGCTWSPKGGMRLNVQEINLEAIEADMEECPDAFYGTCLEQIFGTGNDVRDFLATEQGRGLFAQMMRRIFIGLGNSYSELVHFAQHPLISTINTAGTYAVPAEQWDDYFDQQTSGELGGIVTLLDALGDEGYAGHTDTIPLSDIDGDDYVGDIFQLLNKLRELAKGEFRSWVTNGYYQTYPVILLSAPLYRAYEDYLILTHPNTESAWRFTFTREDGAMLVMPNVLKFKSLPVYQWDEVNTFDAITGCKSFRACMTAPGNFGIAHDVENVGQMDGMGLQMVQKLDPEYKGKVFMSTTQRWGAGIGDAAFSTQIKRIIQPS